jgi:hypothetical protein
MIYYETHTLPQVTGASAEGKRATSNRLNAVESGALSVRRVADLGPGKQH